MRQNQTFPKKNKVDCLLLMGILRLNNLACLKGVCILLCFIVCALLRRYQQIFWSNRCWKRGIQT